MNISEQINEQYKTNHDSHIGLIFCCPYSEDNSNKNCQLYFIREQLKTKKAQFDYWKNLTETEKENIIQKHNNCLCHLEEHTYGLLYYR